MILDFGRKGRKGQKGHKGRKGTEGTEGTKDEGRKVPLVSSVPLVPS